MTAKYHSDGADSMDDLDDVPLAQRKLFLPGSVSISFHLIPHDRLRWHVARVQLMCQMKQYSACGQSRQALQERPNSRHVADTGSTQKRGLDLFCKGRLLDVPQNCTLLCLRVDALYAAQVVFAQFAYYPFWPAVVRDPDALEDNTDLMRLRKKGQVLVEFFGTKNFSWVDRRKVRGVVPKPSVATRGLSSQHFAFPPAFSHDIFTNPSKRHFSMTLTCQENHIWTA
jgi:hypothetical protein